MTCRLRGEPAGSYNLEEVFRHVQHEASKVAQELEQLSIIHIKRENLVNALLSRGGQPVHQLRLQVEKALNSTFCLSIL
jgi:hypothetical protein